MIRWALAGVLAVLAGCAPAPTEWVRVEGWPVDGLVKCAELRGAVGCSRIVEVGREGLPSGFAETAGEPTIYHLDTVDESRREILLGRSGGGGDYVVVFEGKEGRSAVGVWCGAGVEPDLCGRFDGIPY